MATASYGPEQAVGASQVHSIESPADYLASMDNTKTASVANGPSTAVDSLPPPNPHFVFPAAPLAPATARPSVPPAGRRRRPLSAVETHTRSFSLAVESTERIPRHAALPDFSFNPGAALPPDPHALLSPPVSPGSPRTIISSQRPAGHGHRRGGSEFVGGRIRDGSSIAIMSTSPTKSESGFASPMLQLPTGRRGHRRGMSGAISASDLPVFSLPLDIPVPQGGSAPTTPAGIQPTDDLPPIVLDEPLALIALPEPVQSLEQDKTANDSDTVIVAPVDETPSPAKTSVRARVGFSDTVEFIPRPLSLVSSDTSSTATARPGHSVSGSLSSIVSAGSPSGRDSPIPLSRAPTSEMVESRPSTAGAVLERAAEPQAVDPRPVSPRRRNSIPALLDMADVPAPNLATSSPPKNKRWSFFGLEPFTNPASAVKARPGSSSSSDSAPRAVDVTSCSDHGSDSSADGPEGDSGKHKKSGKKDAKKKRVKGWAGSILPLKSKGHKKRFKSSAVRPPTPPGSVSHPDDEDEDEARESDDREREVATPTVQAIEPSTPPRPAKLPQTQAEDTSYPMIDLDAALGPFNTPLSYNPEWEAAQRAAGNSSKRRLHSAQGMKGFSGPGMHYHRRSESAPALPPFDPGCSSIHRFGSSSAMADVFEEDEEEDDTEGGGETKSEGKQAAVGEVAPVNTLATEDAILDGHDITSDTSRQPSSMPSDDEPVSAHSIRAECSKTSLHEEVIVEEPVAPAFRAAQAFQGARDSFESAPSPKQLPGTIADLPPADDYPLNLPSAVTNPVTPYSISQTPSSSHPSPRSPKSIDAQRISTAPSSVTDDSFQSLLMGEPGPEVRISVDYDIPSLTSSTSTMTRDSSFMALPRLRRPRAANEPRPVSVSSAAFGRRRSSLASLSRLISSSHGERSKLSMEVSMESEPEQKKAKPSKTKRLSRMMQFWKPNKDGAAT